MAESRTGTRLGALSANTVVHYHRVLSEALSHAVRLGLVARNVAGAVRPPKIVRKEITTLDTDGIKRFLVAAQYSRFYPVFFLAICTGMRRSELLGLRWKDVDLDLSTLSVVQVLHQLPGGRIILDAPKSAKGRRQIALPPSGVLALRAHKNKQKEECALMGLPLELVFSHADGSPIRPHALTRGFTRIASKAGLNGTNLHTLRHSHASMMLKQGVHPKVVSERLGHATVAITLDTYSHVTPRIQAAAPLRFEEELGLTRPSLALVGGV